MIDVGVGGDYRRDGRRSERHLPPIPLPQLPRTLKHSAVNQDASIIDRKKVLGDGYSSGRSVE